jgi:hypothetical protein
MKRLVYTVACHDREFASLIEFFPVRDAFVICDPIDPRHDSRDVY